MSFAPRAVASFPHASGPFATADLLARNGFAYDWRGRRAAGSLGRMVGDGAEAVLYPDRVLVRGRNPQPLVALLAEHATPIVRPRSTVRLGVPARPFVAHPLAVLCHVDDLGALTCELIRAGFKIDREHLQAVGDASRERMWRRPDGACVLVEANPDASDGMAMCHADVARALLGVEVAQ